MAPFDMIGSNWHDWPQLALVNLIGANFTQLAPIDPDWPKLAQIDPDLARLAEICPKRPLLVLFKLTKVPMAPRFLQIAPIGPKWPQLSTIDLDSPCLAQLILNGTYWP